jgi:cytochrome c biogenesis protein CcmG/thiol:disulfide interchange protein DsbE
MKFIAGLLLVLLVLLVPAAFAQKLPAKAPNFALKASDGQTVELSKFKGKVVVVNFWATWCPPCREEIPDFISLYESYKGRGVAFVGISLDEKGWAVVKPFIEKYKITYPVVLDDGKSQAAYGGIQYIPTTFIVDKTGQIVDKVVGGISKADLEKKIRRYL